MEEQNIRGEPTTCIILCRQSPRPEGASESVDAQETICQEHANKKGYPITQTIKAPKQTSKDYEGIYSVEEYITKRPDLQEIIEHSKTTKGTILLIKSIDRLGRSDLLPAMIRYLKEEHNIIVESVREGRDELTMDIMTSVGKNETRQLNKRLKDVRTKMCEKGWTPVRTPTGYKKVIDTQRKISINFIEVPEEQEKVKTLYSTILSGVSVREASTILKINTRTAYRILKEPLYKGIIIYENQKYKLCHKQLINDEDWEKVQTIIRRKTL